MSGMVKAELKTASSPRFGARWSCWWGGGVATVSTSLDLCVRQPVSSSQPASAPDTPDLTTVTSIPLSILLTLKSKNWPNCSWSNYHLAQFADMATCLYLTDILKSILFETSFTPTVTSKQFSRAFLGMRSDLSEITSKGHFIYVKITVYICVAKFNGLSHKALSKAA